MTEQGGRIVAVSVDDPDDSRKVVERYKLPFGILADTDAALTRAFGILHAGGHPYNGGDIPIPAHFLIDQDGQVAWQFISEHPRQRPRAEQIEAAVAALGS